MSAIFTDWHKASSISSKSSTFKTHLNYVKCIHKSLEDYRISINLRPTKPLSHPKIEKFETLSKITATSIDSELRACIDQPSYCQVVAPWIPVKCYYRLYYLESVFIYLLDSSESVFKHGGHTKVRDSLHQLFERGDLSGNVTLNRVTNIGGNLAHKLVSGANIRSGYYADPECISSVERKISEYKELSWKDSRGFKNFKSRLAQQERKDFRSTQSIQLLDFFYWMRIKANYRDVDFLDFDIDISPEDALEYVKHYVWATERYASALSGAITELKVKRGMSV